AAATWIIPPVTGIYLVHSVLRHPICSFLAAKGIVSDLVAGTRAAIDSHTVTLAASGLVRKDAEPAPEPGPTPEQAALVEALERQGYDDWYSALLHAALDETKDAAKAIEVADAAFADNPTDDSTPRDDDADVLFSAPDAGAQEKSLLAQVIHVLGALARVFKGPWISEDHPRGQPENSGEFADGGGSGDAGGDAPAADSEPAPAAENAPENEAEPESADDADEDTSEDDAEEEARQEAEDAAAQEAEEAQEERLEDVQTQEDEWGDETDTVVDEINDEKDAKLEGFKTKVETIVAGLDEKNTALAAKAETAAEKIEDKLTDLSDTSDETAGEIQEEIDAELEENEESCGTVEEGLDNLEWEAEDGYPTPEEGQAAVAEANKGLADNLYRLVFIPRANYTTVDGKPYTSAPTFSHELNPENAQKRIDAENANLDKEGSAARLEITGDTITASVSDDVIGNQREMLINDANAKLEKTGNIQRIKDQDGIMAGTLTTYEDDDAKQTMMVGLNEKLVS